MADHAFVAYPELRGKLKIYVARSTAVNAFTFDNGTIIVNVGLLANLDNEAQLAFILCHELTHYKDKQVIEGFVENVKIEKKASIPGSRNKETRLLQKSKFSKQQEFAADAQGLEMFYKTQYDKKVPLQCFEILRDYITPFKQIREFTTKFFNPYTSAIQAVIAVTLVPAFHGNDRFGGFYFPSWPSKRREAIEKSPMHSSHGPLNALAVTLPQH